MSTYPVRLDFRSERRGYTLELSEDLFGAFILRPRWSFVSYVNFVRSGV